VDEALYDRIGAGYGAARGEDPRLAAAIHAALGDARSVVNIGAGTGSYEPRDREVLAVEPSAIMRAQRPAGAAPAVAGVAEALPLADGAADAAMAVLTLHHWGDWRAGVAEMRRVARVRVVVCTWDPAYVHRFWLAREYLPELTAANAATWPSLADQGAAVGPDARVEPVPVPHDCRDGFFTAYWRRPAAYLDPRVRAGMSLFSQQRPEGDVEAALRRLAADLESGRWAACHADLLERDALDLGYRLLVGPGGPRI